MVPACRPQSGNPLPRTVPPEAGFVAVIGAGEDDELWPVLRASALRAARDFRGVQVRTVAPRTRSQNQQLQLIDDLRAEGALAMCVQVIDPRAVLPKLEALRSKGLVVVTMVRPVPAEFPFHHCGVYEVDVGRDLAQALVEGLGKQGTVAVLRPPGDAENLLVRFRSFRSELDRNRKFRLLREINPEPGVAGGRRAVRAFCERYPRISGFATITNQMLRIHGPAQQRLVPASCKLVSVDPFPSTWPALAEGWCYALVGAEYDRIAYKAVQWCIIILTGGELRVQTYYINTRKVWAGNLTSWRKQWDRWTRPPASSRETAPGAPSPMNAGRRE
jgi:ABC-type sugar transport system substrate-binding protein